MSKEMETIEVFFSEEIEKIFLEEEDPQYKIFKATRKLLSESINAIDNLGKCLDNEIGEDNEYIGNKEYCDPGQYNALSGDLMALQKMLEYLSDNRNKKKCYVSILPDSIIDEIEEPFMTFNTRKLKKKSRIINPK